MRRLALVLLIPTLVLSCDDDNNGGTGPPNDDPTAALQLDGVQQSTQTPDAPGLDLGNTWTIELWINPNDVDRVNPRQDFVSKWGSGTSASYALWLRDRTIRLSTRQEPTNTVSFGLLPLSNGVWQHIAAVFDNGTVRLYVNGVLDVETAGNFAPQNSATFLSLGAEQSAINFYDGTLDEVRIWNVARSQGAIALSMFEKIDPLTAGLVAYWRMDEGTGDTAFDLTGNGHDMQLGNAVGADAGDPTWVTPGRPESLLASRR